MIRILIVDDKPSKVKIIEEYLEKCGINNENIDFAGSIIEAKKYLKSTQYHILFIDLILPLRAGQEASHSLGITLVEEVCSRGRYYEPNIIVAISEYSDAASEFEDKFSQYMAKVIKFDEINLEWHKDIDQVLEECSRRLKRGTMRKDFDISFICALEDEENQLIRTLGCSENYEVSSSGLRYKTGQIRIGEENLLYTVTLIGRAGPVPSASHTSRVIMDFHPKMIIMTGICAGIGKEINLGDVVIAASSWDWQTGKIITRDEKVVLSIEPNVIQCSDKVESTLSDFIKQGFNGEHIRSDWPAAKPRSAPLAFFGPVASGSSVVASQEAIKNIQDTQHRKVSGLEMESYGMYYSCRTSLHRPLEFVMIKGVSDKADEEKDDSMRHYSAYTAAKFALQYINYSWNDIFNI